MTSWERESATKWGGTRRGLLVAEFVFQTMLGGLRLQSKCVGV
jgi:hypothetical protein